MSRNYEMVFRNLELVLRSALVIYRFYPRGVRSDPHRTFTFSSYNFLYERWEIHKSTNKMDQNWNNLNPILYLKIKTPTKSWFLGQNEVFYIEMHLNLIFSNFYFDHVFLCRLFLVFCLVMDHFLLLSTADLA